MSRLSVASLSGGLLVAKGTAGPSCFPLCDEPGAAPPRGVTPVAGGAARADDISRVTLRIDATRHRRLRIAAAQFGQSRHAVLLAALDHYLDAVVPGLLNNQCRCLAAGSAADSAITMFARHAP